MSFFSGLWESFKNFFTGGGSDSYDSGVPGSRLYVGNLSYRVREEELRSLFSKHGRVKTLHLIRDRLTRRLKGYAFVEMSPEDAQKALSLSGVDFLGRKLVVSIAKSKQKQPHRRSGGGPPQNKWRKRRSGPRVYGQKDSTPIQRLE